MVALLRQQQAAAAHPTVTLAVAHQLLQQRHLVQGLQTLRVAAVAAVESLRLHLLLTAGMER
jgi:hypothetical protein